MNNERLHSGNDNLVTVIFLLTLFPKQVVIRIDIKDAVAQRKELVACHIHGAWSW